MDVEVTARGTVTETAKRMAEAKVGRLDRLVKGPVLGARVILTQATNPRIERPAHAEGEVNLAGRRIRAGVDAPSMEMAISALVARLHRELRDYVERKITRQRSPAMESRRSH